MKNVVNMAVWLLSLIPGASKAQQVLTDATIQYDIVIQTANKEPQMADAIDGATTTVYLKATQSRTDMVSALGNESTIYDNKTGNAVILKEYSGQKLMITLTRENWEEKNKAYKDISYTIGTETKTILGYTCKKAVAHLKDGKQFTVYFSPDLKLSNTDYNTTFENLPGLAMEYEVVAGKTKFRYTVAKINTEPVLSSKFEIPKSGYRVMTYEENQQLKKGNQ
jgi:GLPGLI family protein